MSRPLAAAALFLLSACGGAATTTTAPAAPTAPASPTTAPEPPPSTAPVAVATTTSTPRAAAGRGGAVTMALEGDLGTLNPYAPSSDENAVALLGQLHLVGISDISADLERVPEVVVELPTVANGGVVVNPDGTMTVRYAIRDEARWADGTPISGADLAFTLETLAATPGATLPFMLSGATVYRDVVPGSVAAGPKSFEFSLAEPTLLHEEMFSTILPAHDVAGSDLLADWNDRIWVEGGPFRLDAWDPDASVTFVRNDNYWKVDAEGVALPYLDRIDVRLVPFGDQLLRPFLDREVDVIDPSPFAPTIEELRSREVDGVRVTVRAAPIWEHVNFQFGANNPNADSLNAHVEFRRAVAHALDRQALAELPVFVNRRPLRSYLDLHGPGVGGAGWDRYPHDPDRARELLAGLCAELGRDCDDDPPRLVFSTTSNTDVRPAIGEAVRDMLAGIGVEVELDFQDSAAFFGDVLDEGRWDVGMWAWVLVPGSPSLIAVHELVDPLGDPADGLNLYRWGAGGGDEHAARYAEILEAMRATVDERELRDLARRAEDILADQAVIIPLHARASTLAVWADEVGGVEHNPSHAGFTWNVEEWYRVDR